MLSQRRWAVCVCVLELTWAENRGQQFGNSAPQLFWWVQPWALSEASLRGQSAFGEFSIKSHYEQEGFEDYTVGPDNHTATGFTCSLHPAGLQLKHWLLSLLVHCGVAVMEGLTLTYGVTWQGNPHLVIPLLSPAGDYEVVSLMGRRRKGIETKTFQAHMYSLVWHSFLASPLI